VRIVQVIAALWLALVCVLAPAHAEKRVALVVGNGAYVHADRLANPVNDARGMRDALAALKFDVIYGTDLDGKALRKTISRFNDRVADADVALVYFAGHGATFGDVPYVVPVDAEFASLAEMPAELVAVEDLIGELRRAKTVRIAILDACRDNAAEQALKGARTLGPPSRGLAPPKNPAGLIIAYATQHGATAADSAGSGNSPFTAAILHNIATPGLDVKEMFFKVGGDVAAVTGGRQRPEISISMYEQYALVPGAAVPPPGPADGTAQAAVAQAWGAAKDSVSLEVIDAFLRQYGGVPVYGELARARRVELEKLALAVTPPPRPEPSPPPPGSGPLTAAQERGLKPKDAFRECEGCPEMVVVPAGSFTMGSPDGEKDRSSDESPQHRVTISKPFAAGAWAVTVDQFAAFVKDTGAQAPRKPGFGQDGSHPVVNVTWQDAKAYAEWLARKTGRPYRLLSEAEWEYAARAGTATPFWWGSSITPSQANYNGNYVYAGGGSKGEYRQGTVPAGSFAPNPWGLYNVHGNVWQWTEDCYHDSYRGASPDGSAWTTTCDSGRVVRGGSWDNNPRTLRAAIRSGDSDTGNAVGFRLARTLRF
jgi:formylglycine-generating enzyme required for sulfatase activity